MFEWNYYKRKTLINNNNIIFLICLIDYLYFNVHNKGLIWTINDDMIKVTKKGFLVVCLFVG